MASSSGASLLLSSITTHFNKHKRHREQFYEITEGLSPVSLRLIDWFVTHYAKAHNVLYWIDEAHNVMYETPNVEDVAKMRKFNLYIEYRAQLKSYTKLHFDPFRRHERITFVLDDRTMKTIETTVGQLNFFRWALTHHVIAYISQHLPEIEAAMAAFQKKNKPNAKADSATVVALVPPAAVAPAAVNMIKAPRHIRFD